MLTKLQVWSLWYVKNWMFGTKCFGVAPLVQKVNCIAGLVQMFLEKLKMTDLPFTLCFLIFLLLHKLKKKRQKENTTLSLSTHKKPLSGAHHHH